MSPQSPILDNSCTLITDSASLAEFCAHAKEQSWLACDTEFVRERTYAPTLCLVQIATANRIVCIDMLAIEDPAPLCALLCDPQLIKVFHAARQDMEALLPLCGGLPAPIFDTQIAAALLGFDEQIGYAGLIQKLLGISIEKAHQRTDWSKRPIRPEHLNYAADDVRHLHAAYTLLVEKLKTKGRLEWAQNDSRRLEDESLYCIAPEMAFYRIKGTDKLSGRQRMVLRSLAAWRERSAKSRNLPRSWVVRDGTLIYLAQRQPRDLAALEKVRGLDPALLAGESEIILNAIAAGCDERISSTETEAPLDGPQQAERDRLLGRIKEHADSLGMAPTVLATRRDVVALVRGNDSPARHGWRGEIINNLLGERKKKQD